MNCMRTSPIMVNDGRDKNESSYNQSSPLPDMLESLRFEVYADIKLTVNNEEKKCIRAC